MTSQTPTETPVAATHSHVWQLKHYEKFIMRETCACGAVRFSPDEPGDKKLEARVAELNRTLGKEGDLATLVKYEDLHPETRKKVDQTLANDLAPVPLKPKGIHKVSQYYEDNKEAILHDRETLGEKGMRHRWGISSATWKNHRGDGTWSGLAARWGLTPPAEPKIKSQGKGTRARHHYYEKNKKAIIRDLKEIGIKGTLVSWGISPGAWSNMKKNWKIDLVGVALGVVSRSAGLPSNNGAMTMEQEFWFLRGYRYCFEMILGKGKGENIE